VTPQEVYDDVLSSKKFNDFLNRIGGTVVSSPLQQKRCTIQLTSRDDSAWVFYYNGIIRKNSNSDRLGKVAEPTADWPKNPTVEDILSLIDIAINLLNKRESAQAKKYEKINNSKKYQIILLNLLFSPEKLEMRHSTIVNNWNPLGWKMQNIITTIEYDGFEGFIKRYASTAVLSRLRVK